MKKQPYSKEEKKEKVAEILQLMEQGVTDVFESEAYKMYLTTMAKFHRYSLGNCILIAMQRPGATAVASYTAWKQKFHRQVKKGEKAIKILAPVIRKIKDDELQDTVAADPEQKIVNFRVVSVFDISQTEGDDLPSYGVDELTGKVDGYEDLIGILTDIAPVPVRYEEIEGAANGYYSPVNQEIVLRNGMEQLQTVKTLVHEIAHSKLHADDCQKDRMTKEVEAESVAYALISFLGVGDTAEYSFGYIAGWSSGRDIKELHASLETIRDTVCEFIEQIEGKVA